MIAAILHLSTETLLISCENNGQCSSRMKKSCFDENGIQQQWYYSSLLTTLTTSACCWLFLPLT